MHSEERTELFTAHCEAVYGFARAVTGSASGAAMVTQEVFVAGDDRRRGDSGIALLRLAWERMSENMAETERAGSADVAMLDLHVRRQLPLADVGAVLGLSERRVRRRVDQLLARVAEILGPHDPPALSADERERLWRRIMAWSELPQPEPATPSRRRRATPRPKEAQRRGRQAAAITALVLAGVTVAAAVVAVLVRDGDRYREPVVLSTDSHRVGQPSILDVVVVTWTPVPDTAGYSTSWTRDPGDVPDEVAELPGGVGFAVSPPLEAGEWWFAVRRQGDDGMWGEVSRIGPFVITT